jgi:GT2 family glycosyltransferase
VYRLPFRNGRITYRDFFRKPIKPMGSHRVLEDMKLMAGLKPDMEVQMEAISVIVCTRNRAEQLRECLGSLKKLDYAFYEVIVVDNAPTDDSTRHVVEEMGFRYELENIPGLDRARNRGIRAANHGIVVFTDDDALADRYWLKAVMRNMADPTVDAVTGFVAPAELDTRAQQLFEFNYGGMGHGMTRRLYEGTKMSGRALLAAAGFGVGANMAFRRSLFDRIGYFDPALDVGTPSSGGGDVEMFHRVVARGGKLVYDPDMLVWHKHRRDMSALKRQIFNNGRSFVCYLMTCRRNRTVSMGSLVSFVWNDWIGGWFLPNLFSSKNKVSRQLLLTEISGIFTGPGAYHSSLRRSRELDRSINI